jgi:hypothetical protein
LIEGSEITDADKDEGSFDEEQQEETWCAEPLLMPQAKTLLRPQAKLMPRSSRVRPAAFVIPMPSNAPMPNSSNTQGAATIPTINPAAASTSTMAGSMFPSPPAEPPSMEILKHERKRAFEELLDQVRVYPKGSLAAMAGRGVLGSLAALAGPGVLGSLPGHRGTE